MIRTSLLLAALVLPWGGAAAGNDFPTIERVEYVLGCARDAKGSERDNIYKCSCVIDALATKLTYDEYVEYSTLANAFSIGGERGEVMRGYGGGKELAFRFRKMQAEARKSCAM